MSKQYGQGCPVARSLDLLGDRWTLLIVRDLLRGRGRFQELTVSLPGIAPNILSDRLKGLEEAGIVTRRFYSDHPPRAEYVLTEKGRQLDVVVGALATWGARHADAHATPIHTGCGHPVEVSYRCPGCDQPLTRESVQLRYHDRAAAETSAV
jgi:DNA-binding HxlR family transcriptional regulator